MWSPTGECFYYISSKEGPSDLWKQTLDERSGTPSSEPQRVTSALKIEKFTVSPDGKSILASTRRSTGTIWSFPLSLDRIQSLDVGTQLTVTQDFFDSRPRYAKQMHAIFFNSNRRGSLDIWTLSLDNKNLSRLTSDPTTERLPRPSHTGLWVAYDAETEKSSSVHLMKPDGSNIHLLESSLSQKIICRCCADWSPDDKNLIFVYNLDNGEAGLAIATMDVERGEAIDVQLLDLPGEGEEYPRWSPGGEFFVFESFYDGSWDLWIADSNGKNPYQLTSSPDNERSAAWSPDSRYIFYITPETRCLWRVPMSLAGRPSGPTELWLKPPTRFRVPYDSIDFFDGQLFTSIVEEAVDIWMVEFSKN